MIIYSNINKDNIERIEADVKWYNPERGYGFLRREDLLTDVMIHFSALDRAKCSYIKEGDRIVCDIGPGRKGLQVLHVIEIKYGSADTTRSLSSFLSSRSTPFDSENLEEIEGTIKWFKPEKGYGFVSPNDGRKDLFLHTSVVRTAGYKSLKPGLRVLTKVSSSERGQEVRILRVLHEEEKKKEV